MGAVVAGKGEACGRGDRSEALGIGGEAGVTLGGGERREGERLHGEGGAEAPAVEPVTAHC